MFELHPVLKADTVKISSLELCDVLLQTDANFPWLCLVPRRDGVREIHRLSAEDQQLLMRETSFVSERFEALTGAEKMNVAALGNMVPQLHIHVIARFAGDQAWPGPIWGIVPRKDYVDGELTKLASDIRAALAD
jgi:diadenosine tetraphosphate (Ap4A) HIT family hydrolase